MTIQRPSRKGRIVVDADKCKGCELCAAACPYGIIHLSDRYNVKGYRPAMPVDPEGNCTGCTLCAVMCPDAVITVYRQVRVSSPVTSPGASTPQTRAG